MSLDLDAIEARANAATPGPWTWTNHRVPNLEGVKGDEFYTYSTEVIEADHSGECGCRSACELSLNVAAHDAEFIAHSREDVVNMAAYIRKLEEVRKVAEYALHLRMHGERAPGGDETWRAFDRFAEKTLRDAA